MIILHNIKTGERVHRDFHDPLEAKVGYSMNDGWRVLGQTDCRAADKDDFDEFDDATGCMVRDHKAKADSVLGPAHIAEARALKYLEALLITNGTPLPGGLLAKESEEMGIPLDALAEVVMAKRQDFVDKELSRQRAKKEEEQDG